MHMHKHKLILIAGLCLAVGVTDLAFTGSASKAAQTRSIEPASHSGPAHGADEDPAEDSWNDDQERPAGSQSPPEGQDEVRAAWRKVGASQESGPAHDVEGEVLLRAEISAGEPFTSWKLTVESLASQAGGQGSTTLCSRQLPSARRVARVRCRWATTVRPDGTASLNGAHRLGIVTVGASGRERAAQPDLAVTVANPATSPGRVQLHFDPEQAAVAVEWAPSPEADLAGYLVEHRRDHASWVEAGRPTGTSYRSVLTSPGTYRFRVSAVRRVDAGRNAPPSQPIEAEDRAVVGTNPTPGTASPVASPGQSQPNPGSRSDATSAAASPSDRSAQSRRGESDQAPVMAGAGPTNFDSFATSPAPTSAPPNPRPANPGTPPAPSRQSLSQPPRPGATASANKRRPATPPPPAPVSEPEEDPGFSVDLPYTTSEVQPQAVEGMDTFGDPSPPAMPPDGLGERPRRPRVPRGALFVLLSGLAFAAHRFAVSRRPKRETARSRPKAETARSRPKSETGLPADLDTVIRERCQQILAEIIVRQGFPNPPGEAPRVPGRAA